MADSKLIVFSILLTLIFTHVRAEGSAVEEEEQLVRSDSFDSPADPKIELDQLKSKIHALEMDNDGKTGELKVKDEVITEKEKIIQEKLDSISMLHEEIASFQKTKTSNAEELVGKAQARAGELEKQVEKLKREIETKTKEKEALQSRTNEAEKTVLGLNSKVANLEKIIDEQKSKTRKTERALQVAEEELMKAKFDATSKTKELIEVHGAWLPPWLAVHLIRCQMHWKEHGEPAVNTVMVKVTEKKVQAEKWVEPHLEIIKTKWIPAVKEQWVMITTTLEPHVHSLTTKTNEVYEASKSAVIPHIIQLQEVVDPYFQDVTKFSKPYIDQVATATKPHVDKVQCVLNPYTKKVIQAYGKFLESASMYHHQVQGTVRETLKKHELTRPLATNELVWFAASALLALPIIILSRISSTVFCKRAKKPNRSGNSNHARRKGKRGHPDK